MVDSHVVALLSCGWKFPVSPSTWASRLSNRTRVFSVLTYTPSLQKVGRAESVPWGWPWVLPRRRVSAALGGEHGTPEVPSPSLRTRLAIPRQHGSPAPTAWLHPGSPPRASGRPSTTSKQFQASPSCTTAHPMTWRASWRNKDR